MTQAQIELATKMYDDGMNDSAIGAVCGTSRSTIRAWRIKNDLPSNVFSHRDYLLSEWSVYLAADDTLIAFGTVDMCMATLGISRAAFYQLCWRVRNGKSKKYRVYRHSPKELQEENLSQYRLKDLKFDTAK